MSQVYARFEYQTSGRPDLRVDPAKTGNLVSQAIRRPGHRSESHPGPSRAPAHNSIPVHASQAVAKRSPKPTACKQPSSAVSGNLFLPSVEDLLGQAARVGVGLEHQSWNGADQHGLGDPAFAVPGDVVGHFAAAGGVADVDGVVEVEVSGKRGKVVGVVVRPQKRLPTLRPSCIPTAT
jgi:hypothetical protein